MSLRWFFLSSLWLVAVVGGSAALVIYSYTPGAGEASAPASWPAASTIVRDADRPTLVMFAHPKCPCTRASIGELATLMTHQQGRLDARVIFFQPDEASADWSQTDLWRSAAAIPGVTVTVDRDGREARRFHGTTSGHTVLYDPAGHLLFSGGITEARGHAGDNAGRDAIAHILSRGPIPGAHTPTYGCPIRKKTAPLES